MGVVLTVDGLNAISGERDTGRGRMYVLDPWQRTTVQGWRTSLQEVRQFTFVDERASYAARSGKANEKMGWIEIAAYRERRAFVRSAPRQELPARPVPVESDGATRYWVSAASGFSVKRTSLPTTSKVMRPLATSLGARASSCWSRLPISVLRRKAIVPTPAAKRPTTRSATVTPVTFPRRLMPRHHRVTASVLFARAVLPDSSRGATCRDYAGLPALSM